MNGEPISAIQLGHMLTPLIAAKRCTVTKADVAEWYAELLMHRPNTNWEYVNQAIIDAWSVTALKAIKRDAWKLVRTND